MKQFNSLCIIDDDPITVFGMRKMLDLTVSYKTLNTFVNGKNAIDGIRGIIETNQDFPEVIFLDINMPIMDGWQFLEEFIKLPIQDKVRINIITSSIDRSDQEKWELYKTKTQHTLTYNNKPISKQVIQEMTQVA